MDFYPPCPQTVTGIGEREIPCPGLLVPFSGIIDGTDAADHVLPIARWACSKCAHIVGLPSGAQKLY
jgi:hypothetical protein